MFDYICTCDGMTPLGCLKIGVIIRAKCGTSFWDSRTINSFLCVSTDSRHHRKFHLIEKIRKLHDSGIDVVDCAFEVKIAFHNLFHIERIRHEKHMVF